KLNLPGQPEQRGQRENHDDPNTISRHSTSNKRQRLARPIDLPSRIRGQDQTPNGMRQVPMRFDLPPLDDLINFPLEHDTSLSLQWDLIGRRAPTQAQ